MENKLFARQWAVQNSIIDTIYVVDSRSQFRTSKYCTLGWSEFLKKKNCKKGICKFAKNIYIFKVSVIFFYENFAAGVAKFADFLFLDS